MAREQCRGTTTRGRRCKLYAIEGTDFCRHHMPEERKVKRFVEAHKQGVLSFLARGEADPDARDIYEFVKTQLALQRLVSPVKGPDSPARRSPGSAATKQTQHLNSLFKVLPLMNGGMGRENVEQVLGPPQSLTRENGQTRDSGAQGTYVMQPAASSAEQVALNVSYDPRGRLKGYSLKVEYLPA